MGEAPASTGTVRSVQFTAIPVECSEECGEDSGESVYAPPRKGRLLAFSPSFESDRYYYCCGYGHVTKLSRWISVLAIPAYLVLIIFMIQVGTATAVLFTILLLSSVAASTIYGTVTGSKLCLIPFLFLQVVFMLYTVALLGLFTAALAGGAEFLIPAIETGGHVTQPTAVLVMGCLCIVVLVVLGVTSHIVFLDYVFISELDETLLVLEQVQNAKESADEHHAKSAM